MARGTTTRSRRGGGAFPSTNGSGGGSPAPQRAGTVRTGRGLPGGRAVVGGLLIAAAAAGIFAAYQASRRQHTTRYLVVAHDLAAGSRISSSDLALGAAHLPAPVASRAFTQPGEVTGSVTLGPLHRGDLLQRTQVRPSATPAGAGRVSFAVARERAVAGDLRPGDRVTLVVAGGAGGAEPTVAASDLPVVAVDDERAAGVGDTGKLVITVALSNRDQLLDVAGAAGSDRLTVVRTTEAAGS